jgi:hypothetical protein
MITPLGLGGRFGDLPFEAGQIVFWGSPEVKPYADGVVSQFEFSCGDRIIGCDPPSFNDGDRDGQEAEI